ncbi:hypothetical protein, partial [Paenibacillus glacialis]
VDAVQALRKTADMASGFASGGLGKVFTNARKMANNLGLGEQVMKLKNVMQSLAMKSPKMASVLSTSGHVATQYGKSLVMEQAMQEGMRYEFVGDLVERLGGDKMRAALTWVSIVSGSKRSGGSNKSGIVDGGGSSSGGGSGKNKSKKDTEKSKKAEDTLSTDKSKNKDQGTNGKQSSEGKEKNNITGETNSTKAGKKIHKEKADERRASGEYDTVNEPLKDNDGNIIEVPKRIDKNGEPSKKYQRSIPDAVQGPPKGNIIDDKPVGRPISKDKQEIRRFIDAYKLKYGEPPKQIIIERYDPNTGASVGREIYDPDDFKIP